MTSSNDIEQQARELISSVAHMPPHEQYMAMKRAVGCTPWLISTDAVREWASQPGILDAHKQLREAGKVP